MVKYSELSINLSSCKRIALPVILASLVIVSGLVVAGCSMGFTIAQDTRAGKHAPDFQLENLEGEVVSLSDLRGKPVLINFWASRCASCRVEMPFIQQVYEDWSERGLEVLGINTGESHTVATAFMQSNNYTFPVLLNTRGDIARKYNALTLPTTFLIDKNGIIQYVKTGPFQSRAEIEDNLDKIFP